MPAANGFIVDAVAREQKLVEARDLALKARAIDPSLPSIYVTLSDYSDTHGDYEGARQASETALSLEPKNPWRYSNLAADYLMAGKATRQEPRPDRDLRAAGDGVCTQRGPSPVAHRCCRSVARGPEVQAAKFRNAKDRGPTIRVPDVVEGETAAGVAPRTPARIASGITSRLCTAS